MVLPLRAPLEPMLARLARDLPAGAFAYEPKWDGFRCLAFVEGDAVDLRSRHRRPLARYFPEIVAALRSVGSSFVLDGELLVSGPGGFDFSWLLARLHPTPARVERLARETPASLVAFDLLAEGATDLRPRPFVERRARLEALLRGAPGAVAATPITSDRDLAQAWLERRTPGIDGVVAKAHDLTYQPGRRAMVKVKLERTVDCVVAGLRLFGSDPVVASLLLGLHADGELRHVGVASSFTEARRRTLLEELRPLVVGLQGHPWENGFNVGRSPVGRLAGSAGRWDPREMEQDWTPLRPIRVCEVGYDQLDSGRFRHPARFLRWRPDRDARTCSLEQLALPEGRDPPLP